mgnify:CR=1 FL=1
MGSFRPDVGSLGTGRILLTSGVQYAYTIPNQWGLLFYFTRPFHRKLFSFPAQKCLLSIIRFGCQCACGMIGSLQSSHFSAFSSSSLSRHFWHFMFFNYHLLIIWIVFARLIQDPLCTAEVEFVPWWCYFPFYPSRSFSRSYQFFYDNHDTGFVHYLYSKVFHNQLLPVYF